MSYSFKADSDYNLLYRSIFLYFFLMSCITLKKNFSIEKLVILK